LTWSAPGSQSKQAARLEGTRLLESSNAGGRRAPVWSERSVDGD
jgi:hypothetical protein